MKLYKMKITGYPFESLKKYTPDNHLEFLSSKPEERINIENWESGDLCYKDPRWIPDGWVEWVKEAASYGDRWAVNKVDRNDYSFFWPSQDKIYRSRTSARDKQLIAQRWGAKAIILEAEVGEFVEVNEARNRRERERNIERARRLEAKAAAIRYAAGEGVLS